MVSGRLNSDASQLNYYNFSPHYPYNIDSREAAIKLVIYNLNEPVKIARSKR
jgi:hypothetical protein